ncbi:MAG: hypothetical protein EXS59_00665 [Candidatus Taylorbacteria bacterium]|nr:hypothetical protein [Candidatus Taylorbacteria bacterium]
MSLVQFFWYYIIWHYTRAWRDMMRLVSNYLWFVGNFFSINLLLKTLISPWKRLSVSGGKGGEESFVGAFIINTLMRIVGLFIRLFTISIGVVCLIAVVGLSVLVALVWLCLPAIIIGMFFAGVGYISNAILGA